MFTYFDSFFLSLSNAIAISKWIALTNYTETVSITYTNLDNIISESLFIYVGLTNLLYLIVIFIGFTFYIGNQGLKAISHILNNTDSHNVGFAYLTDLEEEVGSVDDAMIYFLSFAVRLIWLFFCTIFSTFYWQNLSWVLVFFYVVVITSIMVPFMVFQSFGLSFVAYIRGAGRSTSFIAEVVLDIVTALVAICRFFVQNIRLLMLFASYLELTEYIYDSCDLAGGSLIEKLFSTPTLWGGADVYWYDSLGDFFVEQLMVVYYQIHLIINIMTQLPNYFVLSFILFFFLYTTFFLEDYEQYFLAKRA